MEELALPLRLSRHAQQRLNHGVQAADLRETRPQEYYARDLSACYKALTHSPSRTYYDRRAGAEIAPWVEYFCDGVADSFDSVRRRAQESARGGAQDQSLLLRQLDAASARRWNCSARTRPSPAGTCRRCSASPSAPRA